MRLRAALFATTALIAATSFAAADPLPPKSDVRSIAPNATPDRAVTQMFDGSQNVPTGQVDPRTHAYSPLGDGSLLTIRGMPLGSVVGDTVDVLGTCAGDGVTDDRACIAGLFASGRTLVFPAGHVFNLCSLVPPLDYPATDKAAVLVHGLRYFRVVATGATFKVCDGMEKSTAFMIAESSHFTWEGGNVAQSRVGLAAGDENVGVTLLNDVDFRLHMEGMTGLGGNGAGVAGDWNAFFTIVVDHMDGVGHAFDTALLSDGVVTVRATGADANGNSGAGQIGQTGFSQIYDVPLAGYNRTGLDLTDTQRLTVLNSDFSNFSTGVNVSSGRGISFVNTCSHDNPGLGSSAGLNYYIHYVNGGAVSSVGHAPKNISIFGGCASNGGAAVGGPGIFIAGKDIADDETIDGIAIDGVTLDNNNNVGIETDGSTAITHLSIGSNLYKGVKQLKGVGGNALALLSPLQAAMAVQGSAVGLDLAQHASTSGIGVALANGDSLAIKNAEGTGVPVIGMGNNDVPFVRPGNAQGVGQLQDFAGAAQLQYGAGGLKALLPLADAPYAFSALPTANRVAGQHAYCTDCRNPGEALGKGTGTPVYVNGQGTWTTVGSNTPAAN